jgi:outer membrane protein OmpU
MHHRLLLGSTALVGASVLLAGTAMAPGSAAAQGFEVKLSGYTESGVKYGSDETLSGVSDRDYDFFMDTEVHIRADGKTESGINYGSKVEFEADTTSSFNTDEAGLYFSGGFGRVELGRDDGADDVMFVGGEDAQAGTGGIDGDTRNLTQIGYKNTSDAAKATYFTPRLAGFQLGASWTPDTGNDAGGGQGTGTGRDDNGDQGNVFSGGVNWTGVLGPVDLTLAAVGMKGNGENTGTNTNEVDDAKNWAIGGLLGFGGLTVGLGFNSEDDDRSESKIFNAGVKYGFGAANVSIGYSYDDDDSLDDEQSMIVASGDYGLMPGVVIKADVSYNDNDPGYKDSDGDDQDSTYGAVMSIQLNY